MNIEHIAYSKTKRFSRLVLDYLADKEALSPFYQYRPTLDSCVSHAASRPFDESKRAVLDTVLRDQYSGLDISDELAKNLALLDKANTYTITTGHQNVLLTGPLFFPFKVLNVIRIAHELNSSDTDHNYVPVLWMATEDHDRPEIDHVFINGSKISWQGEIAGPVGRMKLRGIEPFLAEAKKSLGLSANAVELYALISDCYRTDRTLAEATRLFCNALFGKFGLVVLDADDARLKQQFARVMKAELKGSFAKPVVDESSARLALNYKAQVNAREINLFHIGDSHRERIERDGRDFSAGERRWTEDEIIEELDKHPGHFSPNVILRPLYQECILPNVAYIGGGGELAYWLQLKELFASAALPFPVLFLRTSAMFLSEKAVKKKTQLGLSLEELFTDLDGLKAAKVGDGAAFSTSLNKEQEAIAEIYAALEQSMTEDGLKRAVAARAKNTENDLKALEKKLVREAKRAQSDLMARLDALHELALPNNKLQERSENFAPLYLEFGSQWSDELLKALDPFKGKFTVLS